MPGRFDFPLSPNGNGRDGSGMGEGLHAGQKSTFGNFPLYLPAHAHASPARHIDWPGLIVSLVLALIAGLALLLPP